ncbi:MAG: hypothetical protein AAF564_17770 [Bacteroidota bacterium]
MPISKPVHVITCASCGQTGILPLKHSKFSLWSAPNKKKVAAMLAEMGYLFSNDDQDVHCESCVRQSVFGPQGAVRQHGPVWVSDVLQLTARKTRPGRWIVFQPDTEEDSLFEGSSIDEALAKWKDYYGTDYGVVPDAGEVTLGYPLLYTRQ